MYPYAQGNEYECKTFHQKYKTSHITDNEDIKIYQIKENDFITRVIQMTNTHLIKCPNLLVIKTMLMLIETMKIIYSYIHIHSYR